MENRILSRTIKSINICIRLRSRTAPIRTGRRCMKFLMMMIIIRWAILACIIVYKTVCSGHLYRLTSDSGTNGAHNKNMQIVLLHERRSILDC